MFLSFVFILSWVEEHQVASRLIEVWLNITKIVGYCEKLPASKVLSSKSYLAVRKGVEDELLVAKLSSTTLQACYGCISPNIKQMTQCCCFFRKMWRYYPGHFCIWLSNLMSSKCGSPAALLQIDFLDKSIYLKLKDIHLAFSTEAIARASCQGLMNDSRI